MVDKVRVGIIGTGNISPVYIRGCRAWDILELTACADLDAERARQVAAEHAIPRALTVEELLADSEIEIIINLTIPLAHAQVSREILSAGKHVYSEKPLATTLNDAKALLEAARARNLRVGCAPDTFLFGNHQTCRKLIDEDVIGKPVAATGFFTSHGPERWHPNPDFFYARGGGPMLDMGPYYITCLVNLLGAAVQVSGTARASFPERTAKDGHSIPVNVPTHYSGVIEFASGAAATLITSFDIWKTHLPVMEIYGEQGTLAIPDPNGYKPDEIRLFTPEAEQWEQIPSVYPTEWTRGIGIADMAHAIRSGRAHRASGALAYHVLEIMTAFEQAAESGTYVQIESQPAQPPRLPLDIPPGMLDD